MRTISDELKAHLASAVTTTAICCKLTRRDSTVMGFTSLDRDIEIDEVTYISNAGFNAEEIEHHSRIAKDSSEIVGLLDSDAISEDDIAAGKYDHAEIELFLINYEDLSQGTLNLRTGWLGEVESRGGAFYATIHGLSKRLNNTIGELFSPLCRADLGDARCGVTLASYTTTGTLTSITSQQVIADSSLGESSGYYAYGVITFTSGDNTGISMEIKESTAGGELTTVLPLPWAPQIGDSYTLYAGCDKNFSTCRDKFDNVVNFRAEPHVPGVDRILETSVTRSS